MSKLLILSAEVIVTAIVVVTACKPTSPSQTSTLTPTAPTTEQTKEVILPGTTPTSTPTSSLSTALSCDCAVTGQATGFMNVGLPAGGKAIDFTLNDVAGKEYTLSRLLAEKPVLMVLGSFT